MACLLLVTCEHGGNRVPAPYRGLFRGADRLLASHAGHDIGALGLARVLAGRLQATLHYSTVTRLLVDLNRSPGHRDWFSRFTRPLPEDTREQIVRRYYAPYRDGVMTAVADALSRGRPVIHYSAHSFTPVFRGEVRNADIGLLYDPARAAERTLCVELAATLRDAGYRVRRNYPYRGSADGLTTTLRRRSGDAPYCGIELELNQAITDAASWPASRRRLADAIAEVTSDWCARRR